MTTERDFDRIASAFMADGPDELSDRVLDAVVDQIHLTRQRRASRVPWRFPTMTSPARVAAAALVGVLAVGGVFFILGRPSQSGVGGPSPAASPSAVSSATGQASPSASAIVVPALTQTFTSARNGFAVSYPAGWTVTAATQPWAPGSSTNWGDPALDAIQTSDLRLVVASQRLAEGQTYDAWLAAYCNNGGTAAGSCGPKIQIGDQTGYLDLDGVPAAGGAIVPGKSVIFDAAVVFGGRGYEFTMDGIADRATFQAFLDSVTLEPSAAIDLPRLTKTFTSPTYGYSVGMGDDWTAKPATRKWVGVDNSPPTIDEIAATGTDTTISAASQALPKGTTFDQWLIPFHQNTLAGVPAGCDGGDPSSWPAIPIGDQMGRLEMLCNAAEAIVEVGGRVYVFGWGNSTFTGASHLGLPSWKVLLKSVAFDPASAIGG